jgi:hypothetical protein
VQLDLFISSSAITASSSSTARLAGLRVTMPNGCRACGSFGAILGSSAGPHWASVICSDCGAHRGWLPRQSAISINQILDAGSRPSTPIVIRQMQKV